MGKENAAHRNTHPFGHKVLFRLSTPLRHRSCLARRAPRSLGEVVCSWAGVMGLLLPLLSLGAGPDGGTPEPILETVVRAERVPTALERTPAAVTVVDADEALLGKPAVGLEETLTYVPGVVARGGANAAQDLRLSIRGFGARSAFGVRGITLLVDGFPESLPDGQAQVDALELGTVRRVEVLRGLAASLYGNAAGGVVRVESARAGEGTRVSLRTSGGSYGLFKALATAEAREGDLGAILSVSQLVTDGYRRHARNEQTTVTSNLDARAGGGALFLSFAFVDAPIAEDPGGLTLEESQLSPRAAAPLNLRFDTGESVRQGRLGVSWTRELSSRHQVELLAFGALRSFQSAIPFTRVSFERDVGGVAVRSTWQEGLGEWTGTTTAAAEIRAQADDRSNFALERADVVGRRTLWQDERVLNAAAWAQQSVTAPIDLTLVAGGRVDWSEFSARDRLLSDGDASGARTFLQPTGRLGAIFHPSRRFSLHASLSQAFETPSTTELVDLANGGFSASLRPQLAHGAEVGLRGAGGALRYELALFGVNVNDGLVRQEDALGRAVYVNAARSRHAGVEAAAELSLPAALRLRGVYTLLDARYLTYAPLGEDLAGRRVPGIPTHQGALGLGWKPAERALVELEAVTTGDRFADDANTVREPLAVIFNLRASYPLSFGAWLLAPFASLQNLLSTPYSDALRINANGGRAFEPAPRFAAHGGVSVAWSAPVKVDAPSGNNW